MPLLKKSLVPFLLIILRNLTKFSIFPNMLIQPVSTIGIEINTMATHYKQYEELRNLSKHNIVNTDSIKCVMPIDCYGSSYYFWNQESCYIVDFIKTCWQQDVHRVITWANKNIIIKIGSISYREIEVLIRIFTGMLNKCKGDKEILLELHSNFVKNVEREQKLIVFEDLPF